MKNINPKVVSDISNVTDHSLVILTQYDVTEIFSSTSNRSHRAYLLTSGMNQCIQNFLKVNYDAGDALKRRFVGWAALAVTEPVL